jgi:hypothetical protein
MRSQLTSLKALIDAILTINSATVDGTCTLNPGDPASAGVVVDGNGNTLRFTFGIPQGAPGATGDPGPPGEVTQSTLDTAIATTALNPAALSPLSLTISDPPTQAEVQTLLNAHNALSR